MNRFGLARILASLRGRAGAFGNWLAGVRGGHRAIFTRIYRRNAWGSAESVSGTGSTRARGADFSAALVEVLARLETRVLLDAPCGDCNWIGLVADAVPAYVGVDVVPELVARCREHMAGDGRTFVCADLTRDPLPPADVVLCRDCLVHFSFADARAALLNFRRSGAKWLLTTTFVDVRKNLDIRTGGWRMLNLQAPPFSFPEPEALIDERHPDPAGRYKRLGLWRMDALPL